MFILVTPANFNRESYSKLPKPTQTEPQIDFIELGKQMIADAPRNLWAFGGGAVNNYINSFWDLGNEAYYMIRKGLNPEYNTIYNPKEFLRQSVNLQNDFNNWFRDTFTADPYTSQAYDIGQVVGTLEGNITGGIGAAKAALYGGRKLPLAGKYINNSVNSYTKALDSLKDKGILSNTGVKVAKELPKAAIVDSVTDLPTVNAMFNAFTADNPLYPYEDLSGSKKDRIHLFPFARRLGLDGNPEAPGSIPMIANASDPLSLWNVGFGIPLFTKMAAEQAARMAFEKEKAENITKE